MLGAVYCLCTNHNYIRERHGIPAARVVDEHIKTALGEARCGCDALRDGFFRKNVKGECLDSERFKMRQLVRIAASGDDDVAMCVECAGQRVSEASLGAACDQNGLIRRHCSVGLANRAAGAEGYRQ